MVVLGGKSAGCGLGEGGSSSVGGRAGATSFTVSSVGTIASDEDCVGTAAAAGATGAAVVSGLGTSALDSGGAAASSSSIGVVKSYD